MRLFLVLTALTVAALQGQTKEGPFQKQLAFDQAKLKVDSAAKRTFFVARDRNLIWVDISLLEFWDSVLKLRDQLANCHPPSCTVSGQAAIGRAVRDTLGVIDHMMQAHDAIQKTTNASELARIAEGERDWLDEQISNMEASLELAKR